jgi:hypothetical protein
MNQLKALVIQMPFEVDLGNVVQVAKKLVKNGENHEHKI